MGERVVTKGLLVGEEDVVGAPDPHAAAEHPLEREIYLASDVARRRPFRSEKGVHVDERLDLGMQREASVHDAAAHVAPCAHDVREAEELVGRREELVPGALICVGLFSLTIGATDVYLGTALWKVASGQPLTRMEGIVLWDIRAPRLVLGILVGASLALSGTVMQGLFRNPLADPGLVGVSAGAGLGAISAIVLAGFAPIWLMSMVGDHLVPVAAFFENLKDGASIEQFIEWFPGVQQAQVEALCKISSRPSLLTGNVVESK